MDQEKANEVVIRISVESADKQCVNIKIIIFLLIPRAAGRPYSGKLSFAPSCCSYMSPSSNSSASTWHLYMAIFTVCTLTLLNLDVALYIPVFITTIPAIFQDVYHQRVGIAGLHYLALGVGLTVGSQLSALFMDRIYLWLKSRSGGVGKPEFRLREHQCSFSLFSSLAQTTHVVVL